jgi:hypothetical protein
MTVEMPRCPICKETLLMKLAEGRKSGKPFVMIICPVDGRHFRGFINDRSFVNQVLDGLATIKEKQGGATG